MLSLLRAFIESFFGKSVCLHHVDNREGQRIVTPRMTNGRECRMQMAREFRLNWLANDELLYSACFEIAHPSGGGARALVILQ